MRLVLRQVALEEKEVLANLLEKYGYEFSQYNYRDVNELGLYGDHKNLDYYWTKDRYWPYFIEVDSNLAGFVMVNGLAAIEGTETDFQMAEFFVMYKYRRLGVGKQAFFQVLDKHQGRWQLKRHPQNTPSVHFWDKAINEYTKGEYELITSHPKCGYDNGVLGDIFFFKS